MIDTMQRSKVMCIFVHIVISAIACILGAVLSKLKNQVFKWANSVLKSEKRIINSVTAMNRINNNFRNRFNKPLLQEILVALADLALAPSSLQIKLIIIIIATE